MLRTIVGVLLGLVSAAYPLDLLLTPADESQEPRRVSSKVPLFGHIYGLITQATGYWDHTSKLTRAEIYMISFFGVKIYVCNDMRLMPIIQRNKALSFSPFMQFATKKYGACSDHTYELHGGPMLNKLSTATRNALAPGPVLDEQNARMAVEVTEMLDKIADGASGPRGKDVMLLDWSRDIIMQASASGVWGKEHPFTDDVAQAFWAWMQDISLLLIGLDVFARRARAGRKIVFDAMRRYISKGSADDCAATHTERQRVLQENGVSFEDRVRLESTFGVAVFSNTAPTAHWALWESFSRPAVLAALREELEREAISGSTERGFILDVAALKQRCPLLPSIVEETQRLHHIHANIRMVMEDTMLDGRYLLKKGAYLQMPGSPIHHDQKNYGPTANEFDAYRFVPKDGKVKINMPSNTFLAWGAPPHLCPARQFAVTEILITLALVALRFDMKPVGGAWTKDPRLNVGDLATMLGPKADTKVNFAVREQYRGGRWDGKMGESKSRVPIASG